MSEMYKIDKMVDNIKLSKKKQKELFLELRKGNKYAREKLIYYNIKLVIYIVNKHYKELGYDMNDLISIGTIGLIKAVDTFDITKNIEFSTYAARCINNEILMYFRKNNKHFLVYSLDKEYTGEDGNIINYLDVLEDLNINIEKEYNDKELSNEIKELVNELPERDGLIISLYYGLNDGKNYNQKQLAELFSISQSYIARIIQRNLKKLESELVTRYEQDEVLKRYLLKRTR